MSIHIHLYPCDAVRLSPQPDRAGLVEFALPQQGRRPTSSPGSKPPLPPRDALHRATPFYSTRAIVPAGGRKRHDLPLPLPPMVISLARFTRTPPRNPNSVCAFPLTRRAAGAPTATFPMQFFTPYATPRFSVVRSQRAVVASLEANVNVSCGSGQAAHRYNNPH
jgi:hypothetical protein